MPTNALLIIDAQYDFCDPKGALYVQGADKDMERLAQFIQKNIYQINKIFLSIDNHLVNDIAHPSFWEDKNKKQPAPFTQITAQEVEEGKWRARFAPEKSLKYLKDLEKDGKFLHFIWPVHCLVGSRGASIDEKIMTATLAWCKVSGKDYVAVHKGLYVFTEHFGIFAAQIPDPNVPETQLNTELIAYLTKYDNAPELAKKMIIIEDCMSDVTGLGHLGGATYQQAKEIGIRFVKSSYMI